MSDFLNNFSKEKYKANKGPEQETTEIEKTSGENNEQNEETPRSDSSNKVETKIEKPKSKFGSLQLRGAAFEAEKIDIDKDYNQFLFKRTLTICITLIVVIAIFVGTYLYLNQTVSIQLVDKTVSQSEKWLKNNDVNYDIINVESTEKPAGTVLTQSIPSGEKIGVLDLQTIEVSSGPNMEEVVNLSGLSGKTKDEINKFIADNMLVNGTTTSEYSDKVDSDKLIRIDFEDDSVTMKNYTRAAKANFVISKGKKSDKKNVKVDNFVNQTTDAVYTWNVETGIMIDEQEVENAAPPGYIVSQSVDPGEMMGFGDILTIEVSKGPGEIVPNLIGYSLENATDIASDSKITVESTEKYSNSNSGVVVDQSIAGGDSIYPEEDTLRLTVSLGKPFINDMTGGTLGDAISQITELNNQGAGLTYSTNYLTLSDSDKEMGLSSGMIKSNSNSNSFVSVGSNIVINVYN